MIVSTLESPEKRILQEFYSGVDSHTRALLKQMASANKPYTKRYRGIDIEVYPKVFFPLPYSSKINGITGSDIITYNGKRVLDVGSGTGIRAIVAGLSGAKEVLAVDINEEAVKNTKANVQRYNLQNRIIVLQSDLFNKVEGRFDVIIGYLPIVPHDIMVDWELAVFDPGFSIHSRFMNNVGNFLNPSGIVKMVHSNKGNVSLLESLVDESCLNIKRKKSSKRFGLEWHFYDLQKK